MPKHKKNLSPASSSPRAKKRKPKASITWQINWIEEITEDLINFYRENPCLWNFQLSSYRNKSKKQNCLEKWIKRYNFFATVNLSEDEIAKKHLGEF
jgi:Alcohol dehydrogenase transcription factor Myb/SANT-like